MLTYKPKHNVLASLQNLTKQNTIQMRPLLLQDCKNVNLSILFQTFFLVWKIFPIINSWEVGIRMSWVEKIKKLISTGWRMGERLLNAQE